MKLPLSNKNVYGMLVVHINMDTWQSWIRELLDEYEEVVVTDREGEVIFSTSDQFLASYGAFSEAEAAAGWQILGTGGEHYAVSASTSSILGWNYYVGYDMKNGQLAGFRLSGMLLLSLVLLMLNGLLISSYMIYRPVGRLVHDVMEENNPQEENDQIEGNELRYIATSIDHLRDDKQTLETALIQQRDKLLEQFELRLVRGEVRSEDEWNEYFTGLHLKSCSCFAAVVLVLNLRGENETQDNVDEDAICLKLTGEIPGELKQLTWMPPVYNACTICSLFGSEDESDLLLRVREFFEGVQRFVEEAYGFRMLMGVSATHTDYRHIRAAYRESINALTMPELHTAAGEDCHFYLSSSTVHGSAYNTAFEQSVRTGIKAMDKVQCYNAIDEFCQYLKGASTHDDATVYLLRFVDMILVTAIDTGLDLETLFPNGLRKTYREMIEVIEPNRVRRYMKWALVDPIIKARTELLENSSYSMMEAIEGKIAESRGNITLTECADALGVHSTYIWKVLKMEKDLSFTDYLEGYKMEEAKRLLLQTDMTVAEIAVELNYANAQNFIRFFSKKTGITPGKFRKLY
ncbi:MAG: helix-turn-helix transcriptional regulator [Lachnospiraceae bacterium]|nr:helix-turn-helix transcriptional regulator [Lachnospiraceae bacterium]